MCVIIKKALKYDEKDIIMEFAECRLGEVYQ